MCTAPLRNDPTRHSTCISFAPHSGNRQNEPDWIGVTVALVPSTQVTWPGIGNRRALSSTILSASRGHVRSTQSSPSRRTSTLPSVRTGPKSIGRNRTRSLPPSRQMTYG